MIVRFSVAALAIFAGLTLTTPAPAIDTLAEATDYQTAYYRALDDNRPLLILVTSESSQPCQKMKQSTMTEVFGDGLLQDFHFAMVDVDNDSVDAKNLIGEGAVPQLIMYEQKEGQWHWRSVEGFQTVAQVRDFIGSPQLQEELQQQEIAQVALQQEITEEPVAQEEEVVNENVATTEDALSAVDYETAYVRAFRDDKPLLVLVTGNGCEPCEKLKTTTLTEMATSGRFADYHFASVNRDQEVEDGKNLIGEGSVPQLVLYEKKDGVWHSRSVKGFQSVDQVESFLVPAMHVSTTAPVAQDTQAAPQSTYVAPNSYVTSPQPTTTYPVMSQPSTMGTYTYPMQNTVPMNYSAPMSGYGGFSGGYSGGFSGGFSSGGC